MHDVELILGTSNKQKAYDINRNKNKLKNGIQINYCISNDFAYNISKGISSLSSSIRRFLVKPREVN